MSIKTINPVLEHRDADGLTPLMKACMGDSTVKVQGLLALGADPNAPFLGKYQGYTSLHLASQMGKIDHVKLLCDYKADVNAQGKIAFTPLMCAALDGRTKVAELLLNKKADPLMRNQADGTALTMALEQNNSELIKTLNNKTDTYSEKYVALTELANVSGLSSRKIEIEGRKVELRGVRYYQRTAALFKQIEEKLRPSHCLIEFQQRIEALENLSRFPFDLSTAVKRIQANQTTFIPVAVNNQHVIYLLFEKGFLVICNGGPKGVKWENETTMKFYKIDPKKFILEMADKGQIFKSYEELGKYCYETLPNELNDSSLTDKERIDFDKVCKLFETIAPKSQIQINCPVYSLKIAMRASYILSTNNIPCNYSAYQLKVAYLQSKWASILLRQEAEINCAQKCPDSRLIEESIKKRAKHFARLKMQLLPE